MFDKSPVLTVLILSEAIFSSFQEKFLKIANLYCAEFLCGWGLWKTRCFVILRKKDFIDFLRSCKFLVVSSDLMWRHLMTFDFDLGNVSNIWLKYHMFVPFCFLKIFKFKIPDCFVMIWQKAKINCCKKIPHITFLQGPVINPIIEIGLIRFTRSECFVWMVQIFPGKFSVFTGFREKFQDTMFKISKIFPSRQLCNCCAWGLIVVFLNMKQCNVYFNRHNLPKLISENNKYSNSRNLKVICKYYQYLRQRSFRKWA